MDCTIYVGKTKVLVSCAVTVQLISMFVLVYAKKQLSHDTSQLTHISLVFFLWDIDKRNSPRCDAAKRGVPSGAILFAYLICIEK